jgi:hypothetical protein
LAGGAAGRRLAHPSSGQTRSCSFHADGRAAPARGPRAPWRASTALHEACTRIAPGLHQARASSCMPRLPEGLRQVCTRSAPGLRQVCARSAPAPTSFCIVGLHKDCPRLAWPGLRQACTQVRHPQLPPPPIGSSRCPPPPTPPHNAPHPHPPPAHTTPRPPKGPPPSPRCVSPDSSSKMQVKDCPRPVPGLHQPRHACARSAPGLRQVCARSAPGLRPVCTRSAPALRQLCASASSAPALRQGCARPAHRVCTRLCSLDLRQLGIRSAPGLQQVCANMMQTWCRTTRPE